MEQVEDQQQQRADHQAAAPRERFAQPVHCVQREHAEAGDVRQCADVAPILLRARNEDQRSPEKLHRHERFDPSEAIPDGRVRVR